MTTPPPERPEGPGLFTDSPAPGTPYPYAGLPPYESEAPRRRTGYLPLALTGVAGLLLGALVVGLVWAATASFGSDDSNAAADAQASCDIFDRLPDAWTRETFDLANTNRLAAAYALATSAAQDDKRYQSLSDAAQQAHQTVLTFQLDAVGVRIQDARNECAKL
ncbi:hypothetical protein [Paractinoplanes deccanensis]|nr:hypothetical protein [Actinoplanes deccanensis]